MSDTVAALAIEHLLLRLRPINRALGVAVERQTDAAARLARPDVTALCITDDQARNLLADVESLARRGPEGSGEEPDAPPGERAAEDELRSRAAAAAATLPLDLLSRTLSLSPFEQEAVLLCAAPEVDRAYERIFAYVLDDLNRRFPCVELICSLTARSLEEKLTRRHLLSRFGRLRRSGVLLPHGEPATEARQELRLGTGLLDFLVGATGDPTGLFREFASAAPPQEAELPPEVGKGTVERLGKAFRERRVSALGVWGPRHSGRNEVVAAVAAAAGLPLRALSAPDLGQPSADPARDLRDAVQAAAVLGAMLWVDADTFSEPPHKHLFEGLAADIASARVPACLTGVHPSRPARLLEAGGFAEVELNSPDYATRRAMWERALPESDGPRAGDLAARYRLSSSEMRSAVKVARTRAHLNSNGRRVQVIDEIDAACATVTRGRSHHYASAVKPRRGPDDLVLPKDIHRQVIEVANFFRAGARVDEEWGFGRMTSGGGIKALFTGEPGTGKTLSAEVIAGLLGLPLLKVDLARVVSKWVGETEKNLEVVFREAEESHSVLFFDEADSLFGKRGEVRHGSDRYSNLEVGYLLQRLEDYYGLVVLASNLKDQIDPAFTRRFQVIIHFPMPSPEERRRIWRVAFPESAPLDPGVDLDSLQHLIMTGAAIVSAARTAALLAADARRATITMADIVQGIARQFQREARILRPTDVGPYAVFLNEAG